MHLRQSNTIVGCVTTLLACTMAFGSVQAADDAVDTVASLSGIEIVTSVDRAEVFIGDLITYTVAITYDTTMQLIPPPLGANLGAFDVKDYKSDIVTELPDGRERTESSFILSTFTTGDYIIPPVPVGFKLADGSRKVLLSEAVPITVKSMLLDGDDSTDIHALKEPHEFMRDLTTYYLLGGLGALVLLSLFWFWWRWRHRLAIDQEVDLRPAWEIAFEQLALLKQEDLPGRGHSKQYYINLTEIARDYLGRMYAVNVLDMTTEEFIGQFTETRLPDNLLDDSSSFLRHADLVKFAKFEPQAERMQSDFEFVHSVVELIRSDFERQQAEREAALKSGQVQSGETRTEVEEVSS